MDTKTRVSEFQNPSRDVRGQLETRRHRVHGVGSLESIAASPSVALYLCVSKSVQGCARTAGNTEAQSPRSRHPGIYCSLPLCGSVSLCFKIRPGSAQTVGNTEAQSSRSRHPGILCSLSLCVSVSLCFKIRPGILESATSSCVRAEATNLVPPRIIGLEMILCLVNWSPTLLPRQSAN